MDLVRTFLSVDLKHVGTPRSLQGFYLSVMGVLCLCPFGMGIHEANSGKMTEYLKIRCMREALSSQKGVILKSNQVVFIIFGLFQLIYPQVNTLDTKLSVRISSEYWICQFSLNPFELLKNEFTSRVDRQDGSFKKPLTGSLRSKSILFKSRSKTEVVSIGDKELFHANSKSPSAIELFSCK